MCLSPCCRVIPVILVFFTIFWSYYVYVGQLCMYNMENNIQKPVYVSIFHVLFVMMTWSYFACTFTKIARVPPPYKLPYGILEVIRNVATEESLNDILTNYCRANRIRLWTRTEYGYIRFCHKCRNIKPDRAHHCSTCDICILKMDHHCPWMNTCINFSNYKMFILYNFYCSLYCMFYAFTSLEFVLDFVNDDTSRDYHNIHIVVAFVLALAIGFLMIIVTIYHINLVFKNRTTLESINTTYFIYDEDLTFNISPCYNWRDVFGDADCICWTWWFPTKINVGNGVEFFTAFA